MKQSLVGACCATAGFKEMCEGAGVEELTVAVC